MLGRLWVFGRQLSWSGGSERGAAVTDREVALLLAEANARCAFGGKMLGEGV